MPDQKACTIEQPAGRDWRHFHQVTLPWIGGIAIIGMLALLVVFYLVRGMVRIESGRSGRTIVRFNAFERLVHWMTATCFILLALSGLNITFGKPLLLPLMSPEAFTALSQWGKYAHNYLSFPFTLGVVLIFLMWIAGNIPNKTDVRWLKEGGGIVGHKHPPAGRFNAGQKLIYWIVVLGGGAVATSGYLLMFPFYGTDIAGMQVAQIVHGVVAVLFVAAMLGHIYIGTIGMEGALRRCGTAPSTSIGRRSTTASGSRRSWPKAARRAGAGRPDAGCRIAALQIEDYAGIRRALFYRDACEPSRYPAPIEITRISLLGSFGLWPSRACNSQRGVERMDCYKWPHARHRPSRLERLRQNHAPHQGDPPHRGAGAPGVDGQARPSRLRRRSTGQGFPHPSHGRRHRGAGRLSEPLGAGARVARGGRARPRCAARRLSPVDLVLVEGYKRERHPKLEVYRAAVGKPLLQPDDPAIVAIASDQPLPEARVPVVALDDVDGIVDILLRHAVPLDALLASVGSG